MAETPHATDRSPFRRFPWVQLAFCLACLTMTAWTWMRYSYAWEVTPGSLAASRDESILHERRNRYVYVRGEWLSGSDYLHEGSNTSHAILLDLDDRSRGVTVVWGPDAKLLRGEASFTGRLGGYANRGVDPPVYCSYVIANVSRFHPASIAGIVVGLMGCFVFGLYLRRWVKERRAGG